MINREDYHKLLDICIDVTEKTSYRANYEAYNVIHNMTVWLFDKNDNLKLSYCVSSPADLESCIHHMEEIINGK